MRLAITYIMEMMTMTNNENTDCVHINETIFMTNERRICPCCGKIYYYDSYHINWEKIKSIKLNKEINLWKN